MNDAFTRLVILGLSCLVTISGATIIPEEEGYPVYTVKEIVEVTSDWSDVTWPIGPYVVYSNYTVTQGSEYIDFIRITGLEVWVIQKCLKTPAPKKDCGFIVIEIDAVILEGPSEGQIMVESGDIGYTNIRCQVSDNVTGLPVGVVAVTCREPAVTARGKKEIFDLDISEFYLYSSGALYPEESLRVRDVKIDRLETLVANARSIVIIVAILVAIIFWSIGYFTRARVPRRALNTVLLIVGLVVGAGGVYFTTSTPMQSKISDLEEQVASLNSTISTLRARERIDYLSRQDWDLGMNLTMLAHILPGDPVFLSVTSQQLGTRTLWLKPREIKLTHLQLKGYYELNFMAINLAGGDALGFLVAMHFNGYGFIVNFSSQEHVSCLFESIDTPEEALELIQLAYHRSGYSAYTREYMEITSNEMYLSAVAELRARKG